MLRRLRSRDGIVGPNVLYDGSTGTSLGSSHDTVEIQVILWSTFNVYNDIMTLLVTSMRSSEILCILFSAIKYDAGSRIAVHHVLLLKLAMTQSGI